MVGRLRLLVICVYTSIAKSVFMSQARYSLGWDPSLAGVKSLSCEYRSAVLIKWSLRINTQRATSCDVRRVGNLRMFFYQDTKCRQLVSRNSNEGNFKLIP